MIFIQTNHGTGDTYMTLAFAKAVERIRKQPVLVMIPPHHGAIAQMFPDVQTSVDGSPRTYCSEFITAHPSAVPSNVRIDHLCLLGRRLCHADLWRAMLGLPADEPMRRGERVWPTDGKPKTALLIPEARSMPNSAPDYWLLLAERLKQEGWSVSVNNPAWSLGELFDMCARTEWVIGAQCGVMAILTHVPFPCRKTIATPSLDGHSYFKHHYPYAGMETFAGERYDDVEEIKITSYLEQAVEETMAGRHGLGLPVRHGIVHTMWGIMSVGEFLDRFSILRLKVKYLSPEKRAQIMTEYMLCREVVEQISARYGFLLHAPWTELQKLNEEAWKNNDVAVGAVMKEDKYLGDYEQAIRDGAHALAHYSQAVRLNKERMRLRQLINEICGSQLQEVKSYYA